MNRNTKLTLGIGLTVAGAGLIAAALYYRRKNALGLGSSRVPILAQHTNAQGKTVTHYQTDRLSLDDRVGLIQDLIFASVKDPEMMVLARRITSVCPARDGLCEAAAIDNWVRQNIRYTGDVAPLAHGRGGVVEPIDYFSSARRVVEMGGEDCDGMAILNATLLTLNGIEARLRVTAPGIFSQYGHIYVVAGLPKGANGSWLAMDTTLPAPYQFGDEMPYGKKRDYIPFVKEFAA